MKKWMKVVLVIVGAIMVLAAVNFAPMVSPKTPGMEAYASHGLTVWATEKDAPEVDVIAERIATQSAAVIEALGDIDASGIEVIVYPDRKALHRKTIGLAGYLLPDWFIGDNTTKYVLITSPAEPGPSHSRESIVQAAVHEYVHLLTDRRNRELGYWMKEGIALYLAEQTPEIGSIRSHSDLTYSEFANPSALQFAEVGGYTLAYTMIEYLIAEYGWQSVVDLVDPEASYQSVLGVSERELFDSWMGSVRSL